MELTTIYVIFVVIMNTFVQLFVSKKDIKLYTLIWIRDMLSLILFVYLHVWWQVAIIAWQFALTYSGFLCWKHEQKTGEHINQVELLKMLLK